MADDKIWVKVASSDRQAKHLTKVDSIASIIEFGKRKFNLSGDNIQVTLDDNTEIDDFDYLLEDSRKKNGEPIFLIVVNSDDRSTAPTSVTSQNNPGLSGEPVQGLSRNPNSRAAAAIDLETYVWPLVPEKIIEICEKGERAEPNQRLCVVKLIVHYLCYTLKDTRRGVCYEVAKRVFQKYPNAFIEAINGQVYGTGYSAFATSIYNGTFYREARDEAKESSKSPKRSATNELTRNQKKRKVRKEDGYGCVEFHPELPEGETAVTQEEKRAQLAKLKGIADHDLAEISRLMEETYPTQRASIISQALVKTIIEEWPFLQEKEHLLKHFDRLMGKSIMDCWTSFARTKLERLLNLLSKVENYKKNKEEAKELIEKCKAASADDRSDMPKTISIFPLLIQYFGEKETFFSQLIEPDVAYKDVAAMAECTNPVIIIKGHSIFDPAAKFYIVIEREVCIVCPDYIQAVLALFASYFVFGMKYPPKSQKTLEFIQRVIMLINPNEDGKGTKLPKKTPYHAAVFTLAQKIE